MFGAGVRAYLCVEPVDMRKSIDGLSQLVGPAFSADPFGGQVFVFVSRRRDKVKLLWWDRHGFWLAYKRLERGRFPKVDEIARGSLSSAELMAYLEGIDLNRVRRLSAVRASRIA